MFNVSSCLALAVRPTPDADAPTAFLRLQDKSLTSFPNWLLPPLGSPINKMLKNSLARLPSLACLACYAASMVMSCLAWVALPPLGAFALFYVPISVPVPIQRPFWPRVLFTISCFQGSAILISIEKVLPSLLVSHVVSHNTRKKQKGHL